MKSKTANFKNKNIYIIGGSGLIGSEITKTFCQTDGNVFVLDIKKNKKLNDYKYKFIKFDCTKLNLIKKNLYLIFKQHGYPTHMINASYPRTKDWGKNNFSEISLSSLKKNIDHHLISFVWISKTFADIYVENKITDASIVLLASIYGSKAQDLSLYKKTNMRENVTYSIIKGGIVNYVRQMASYYGKFGVRINSISPGGIEGIDSQTNSLQNSLFKKNYINKVPLKRFAKPQDVASSVLFLSSENSSYITGANLFVDGGISII